MWATTTSSSCPKLWPTSEPSRCVSWETNLNTGMLNTDIWLYTNLCVCVCVCVFLCVCAVWQSFTLDAATMTYPPVSVCTEGTESIQRFLCSGEVYSIIKLAFGLLQKKIFESNTSLWVSMTTSVVSLRHLLATAHINTRNSFIIICGGFNVFYVIVKWEYLLSLW